MLDFSAGISTQKSNFLADNLSRLRIVKFKKMAPPNVQEFPHAVPEELWPMSKIWLTDLGNKTKVKKIIDTTKK